MSESEAEGAREPTVVRRVFNPEVEEQLLAIMDRLMNRIYERVPSLPSLPTTGVVSATSPMTWELSREDETTLNEFMESMNEDIEKYAKDLLRAEIRDRLVRMGPAAIARVRRALKKGKKPALKRKTGCIYIQFGDGSPNDPIDEWLIANTGG